MQIAAKQIALALENAGALPMRQNSIMFEDGTLIIDDSYNANPDSMRASLRLFSQMERARPHIAVLGDMAELGDAEDVLHEQIGEFAALCGIDALLATGDLARLYAKGALKAKGSGVSQTQPEGENIIYAKSVEQAAGILCSLAKKSFSPKKGKPIILVKASRFMKLERIIEMLQKKEESERHQ